MAKQRKNRTHNISAKFQGRSLREQTGEETHYVSDLPDTYDAEGYNVPRCGIFKRDTTDPLHTKGELIKEYRATTLKGIVVESAEDLADADLDAFLSGKTKKQVDKPEKVLKPGDKSGDEENE